MSDKALYLSAPDTAETDMDCRLQDVLHGITVVSRQLFDTDDTDAALGASLETLACAAGAQRAYLMEVQDIADNGERHAALRAEWVGEALFSLARHAEVFRENGGLQRWLRLMDEGHFVHGRADALPVAERDSLRVLGCAATIVLPILIRGRLWGWLGLDHAHETTSWTDQERQALQTLPGLFAGFIRQTMTTKALHKQEREHRAMTEHATDIIWNMDLDLSLTYLNPAVKPLLGFWPEELIGMSMSKMLTKSSFNCMSNTIGSWDGNIQPGKVDRPIRMEVEMTCRNGRTMWTEVIMNPLRDANGMLTGISGVAHDITQRLMIEEVLVENQQRYENLFDYALFGFCMCEMVGDEQGRPVDFITLKVNGAFEQILDLKRAEVSGKRLLHAVPKLAGDPLLEVLARVAQNREATRFEQYVPVFEKYLEFAVSSPRRGIVAIIFSDISERKAAEQALRESERRYYNLFDSMPLGLFHATPDGRLLEVNQALVQLLGYPHRRELLGGDMAILFVEPAQWRKGLEQVTARRAMRGFELPVRRYDGSQVWVRAHVKAVQDLDGAILHYEGSLEDITEHRNADLALRESEERFRQIVSSINQVFWMRDTATFQIQYVSPAYELIWGRSCDSLYDNSDSWLDDIVPEDRLLVEQHMERQGQGHITVQEYRILQHDDSVRWVLDRAFPVRDEQGRVFRLAGIVEDITERKRMQYQIRQSLSEKDVLLKEIHHRVKNNMQILSSLSRMQARKVSDDHFKSVLLAGESRIRSMALIHEKLYHTGRLSEIVLRDYLNDLVREISHMHDFAAGGFKIDIRTDNIVLNLDTAIPCGLIVNELLSNSLKHAFPDGRKAHIAITVQERSPGRFTMRVADNGVGLPADFVLEKAESFGLQLVDLLIKQLDGTFSVNREHGTEMVIQFNNSDVGDEE